MKVRESGANISDGPKSTSKLPGIAHLDQINSDLSNSIQPRSMIALMSKHTICFVLTILVFVAACSAFDTRTDCSRESLYSRYGITAATTKSPDGKRTLMMEVVASDSDPDGLYTRYQLQIEQKRYSGRLPGWRSEVLWSPDSRSFAVNQTVGGGGIGQRAYIFQVRGNRLQRFDVPRPIERAFGSPVKCEVPTTPNTAVLQWLDPKRILVVAEVVNVSICKCSGTYETYELSLPGLTMLRRNTQAETKTRFSDALGCELRDADDRCARTWQPRKPLGKN